MNGPKLDPDDPNFEFIRDTNGRHVRILRDGGVLRTRMVAMDCLQKNVRRHGAHVVDAARQPVFDAARHQPGYRLGDDERDMSHYNLYDKMIADEYKNPPTGAGSNSFVGARPGDLCTINGAPGHLNSELQCVPDGRRSDARDAAALEAVFQQTQTHHEGGGRLDAMMRDHQANMAAVYAAYNHEMSEAWRRS